MAHYEYLARDKQGAKQKGALDAASIDEASRKLAAKGFYPVSIKAVKARQGASGAKESAITIFEDLGGLLASGVTVDRGLALMAAGETVKGTKTVLLDMLERLQKGQNLSDAVSAYPDMFGELAPHLLRAGESSGALVEVLRRMADHFERFAQVQSKLTSALVYPAFVLVIGIVIMFFFMTYMLPKFLSIFDGLNVPLPIMTQILVKISHLFSGYWWLMLGVAIAAVILFKRFQATDHGRRKIDEWRMKAPIFGKVIKLNIFGQFARTLSTLLENGVPVLTALKITEQIIPNLTVKEAIAKTREEVTDGKTIAQPLARSKIFPQLMVDLVKIGEETGDVPGALKNVADTYENELSIALRVMTNMIEPVLIIVMAVGVGFLLLSVLSAMFAITANIAR